VITINEVTIVGRVQKPVASVDVSKIQAKLTLAELRQPFLDRIEEADAPRSVLTSRVRARVGSDP
jgi:hypothetical protein